MRVKKPKSDSNNISLYDLQAKLLGIDANEFHEKMQKLNIELCDVLLQGVVVHAPGVFQITPRYLTTDHSKIMLKNTRLVHPITTRIVPRFALKPRFKNLLRESTKQNRIDLF